MGPLALTFLLPLSPPSFSSLFLLPLSPLLLPLVVSQIPVAFKQRIGDHFSSLSPLFLLSFSSLSPLFLLSFSSLSPLSLLSFSSLSPLFLLSSRLSSRL